jgi:hypothetical protein
MEMIMDKLIEGGESRFEEAIAMLQWIAVILCFAYGFYIAAWIFVIRAVISDFGAISFAVKAYRARSSILVSEI